LKDTDVSLALDRTIAALSSCGDDALSKACGEGYPDPTVVAAWAERLEHILLHERDEEALRATLPDLVDQLLHLLRSLPLPDEVTSEWVITRFLERLPEIRRHVAEDVEAAFQGDPAAKSHAEVVVAHPSIHALALYRLAHALHALGVPLVPRIVTERAHATTGIDIHPGARIGRSFFIDHGTGVVIGETSEIGDRVRLYQGVTLGALSPRLGQSIRGVKRHPTLEDDVTIYPGATILGGETVIGRGSVIGGNAFLTHSVPPGSRVVPETPRQRVRPHGFPELEADAEGAGEWEI
jgi:serine O-acetyltransferase